MFCQHELTFVCQIINALVERFCKSKQVILDSVKREQCENNINILSEYSLDSGSEQLKMLAQSKFLLCNCTV